MNFLKIICSIILFCITPVCHSLFGTKIDGTSSVVVKTTSYNFDADSNPIGADGAVWLQAGFTAYQDQSSLDTELDVVFPVNGTIDLNGGGIVSLLHDLTLGSDASITGTGELKGNSNTLFLTNDLTYTGTNTLTIAAGTGNACTIDGGGNTLTLDDNATLSLAASQTLTLKNMDLTLKGTLLVNATATLILDNVRLHLDANTTFSTGALTFYGSCSIDGPSGTVLTYASTSTLTVGANSQLLIDDGITLKRTSQASFDLAAVTSRLWLRGATFESNTHAVTLDTGQLWIDHHCYMKGTNSGSVTLGDATFDLAINILPGATLDVTEGTVTYVE